MIVPKPKSAMFDPEKNATFLYFGEKDEDGIFTQARAFYIRGAIAWPQGRFDGFALLAGMTLDTEHVFIFEEFNFITVSQWVRQTDKALIRKGLDQWLNTMWQRYFCRSYFTCKREEIPAHYMRQLNDLARKELISPQPELVPIIARDEEDLDNVVEEYTKLGRLIGDQNSQLYQDLDDHRKEIETRQGVWALRYLLAGYDLTPWYDPQLHFQEIEYYL